MTNVIFLRWLAAPAFDQWSIWACEMIGALLGEKLQWKGFVKNKFFSRSNFTHTQHLALKWYFPIQDYLFIVSKPTHRHEPKTIKGRDLSITNRLDPSRVSVRLYNVTCDFCQPEHIEQNCWLISIFLNLLPKYKWCKISNILCAMCWWRCSNNSLMKRYPKTC